jgi:hypothetical protein
VHSVEWFRLPACGKGSGCRDFPGDPALNSSVPDRHESRKSKGETRWKLFA